MRLSLGLNLSTDVKEEPCCDLGHGFLKMFCSLITLKNQMAAVYFLGLQFLAAL